METNLAKLVDMSVQSGRQLSVLVADIDHFKRINDTYGHLVGDDVLRDVAQLLAATIRGSDIVARYGGEEFLVLLPETDDAGAESFAERIRVAVETHLFAREALSEPLRLTASVGVAVFPAARIENVEDLFQRADAALYRAKAEGRNRVRM
jgi:two-component system cell cycle response regulator